MFYNHLNIKNKQNLSTASQYAVYKEKHTFKVPFRLMKIKNVAYSEC